MNEIGQGAVTPDMDEKKNESRGSTGKVVGHDESVCVTMGYSGNIMDQPQIGSIIHQS